MGATGTINITRAVDPLYTSPTLVAIEEHRGQNNKDGDTDEEKDGGTVSRCATVTPPGRASPRAARARRALHPNPSRSDTEEKGPANTVEKNVTQTKDNDGADEGGNREQRVHNHV